MGAYRRTVGTIPRRVYLFIDQNVFKSHLISTTRFSIVVFFKHDCFLLFIWLLLLWVYYEDIHHIYG